MAFVLLLAVACNDCERQSNFTGQMLWKSLKWLQSFSKYRCESWMCVELNIGSWHPIQIIYWRKPPTNSAVNVRRLSKFRIWNNCYLFRGPETDVFQRKNRRESWKFFSRIFFFRLFDLLKLNALMVMNNFMKFKSTKNALIETFIKTFLSKSPITYWSNYLCGAETKTRPNYAPYFVAFTRGNL